MRPIDADKYKGKVIASHTYSGVIRLIAIDDVPTAWESDQIVDIVKRMIDNNISVSTMESCTSGLIASMITDTEGASAIFPGGYVTYANDTKSMAGVDAAIIKKYGVYSKECAIAMATAAKKNLNTEISIGITGTTGNLDPNNADSVQGQAFFCIVAGTHIYCSEIREDVTNMSRHEIKLMYADKVFDGLSNVLDRYYSRKYESEKETESEMER